MEERLTCELAWKLNREKLIQMANQNTFNALATAFELAWDLATEVKKDDSPTNWQEYRLGNGQ